MRTGIREAYERRAAQITADREAWAALVKRAGSETAMLTLRGEGSFKIIATLDGKLVDLPLIVEEPPLSVLRFVYLTDAENKARIYLGFLPREVQDHPAFYDNRLFRIASEVGLD